MKLYLVPSPIGNLGDITYRAVEVLRSADKILCEDTRTSGVLLKHYQISKPLIAFHQHNEHRIVEQISEEMASGAIYAMITDAGTPGISDPGFLLVRACAAKQIPIECLPGASAFVSALVLSALPISSFVFEGFLPLKKGRKTKWEAIAEEARTVVIYESPHRMVKCLDEINTYMGPDRPVSVSREITKLHEETIRGTAAEVLAHFTQHPPRGEFVVVIGGKPG